MDSNVYKTSSPLLSLPSAANGVTVTPSGIADGWSAWVELTASAATAMRVVSIVAFPGVRAVGNYYEVELGVGAAAAESAVAAVRGYSGNNAGGNSDASDILQFAIPADVVSAGNRLSVRLRQTSTTTTAWRVAIQYWALPMTGTVDASTVGPVNVPSGSYFTPTTGAAGAYGSWVEVSASTDGDWTIGNVMCIGPNGGEWEVQFGIGGSGSEVPTWSVRSYARWFAASNAWQGGPWNILLRPALGAIPAGSRLAIRVRSSAGVFALGIGLTVTKQAVTGAASNLRMLWSDWTTIASAAGGFPFFTPWTTMLEAADVTTDIAISGLSKTYPPNGQTGRNMIQIGVGDEGSEELIAECYINNSIFGGGKFNFPLPYAHLVTTGTRVALRFSTEYLGGGVNTAFTLSYQEVLTTPDFQNWTDLLVQQAYVTTSAPVMRPMQPVTGGSAWTNGAWLEVDASVPVNRVITAYEYMFPNAEGEVDIGIGALGAETVVTTVRWSSGASGEGGGAIHDVIPGVPVQVAESSRLVLRARCSIAGAQTLEFTPHYTAEGSGPTPPTPTPIPGGTTFRIRRERISPTVFSDGKRVFHQRLQLDCQPGIGNTVDPGQTPMMLVYMSDDGGHTWFGPREMFPGEIGHYRKLMRLYQLGSSYNRAYKVVCDSPNAWVIAQAFLDIEGATH